MISKLVLVSALAAGGIATAGIAQTASPQAPATPAPAPATAPATAPAPLPAPQAVAARIALIELIDAAAATNEGQKALADIQKKYEPTKAKMAAFKADIDSLTKQLQ